jgi:hypothetical protein
MSCAENSFRSRFGCPQAGLVLELRDSMLQPCVLGDQQGTHMVSDQHLHII